MDCFLSDGSLLKALLQYDNFKDLVSEWRQSWNLPRGSYRVVLPFSFGPPVCCYQQLKVFLSCCCAPSRPCCSLCDGAFLQKWLFLLLQLLVFSVSRSFFFFPAMFSDVCPCFHLLSHCLSAVCFLYCFSSTASWCPSPSEWSEANQTVLTTSLVM